jgi:dGTPase
MQNMPAVHLAPYATRSDENVARANREPDDPLRTPFEVDRHRIIGSMAFRRLEGKTQVFAPSHHDHFRTRLTHTLEVAQLARTLAHVLNANASLAETIAFAHDLGHPPFGHAGEAALTEAMAASGGFNHNLHSLRVVEYLEHPFPTFRGLNLTAAVRDGLRTHATSYDAPEDDRPPAADLSLREVSQRVGGSASVPSVEAQIASLADRIAYNCHDLEDAIGAGFIGNDELHRVSLWREASQEAKGGDVAGSIHAVRRVVLDVIIDRIIADVAMASGDRIAAIATTEPARTHSTELVAPNAEIAEKLVELEAFLFEQVYRREEVAEMDDRGCRMVLELFAAYRAKPDALPDRFAQRIEQQGLDRVICDYIAGMTDRFCTDEHGRWA